MGARDKRSRYKFGWASRQVVGMRLSVVFSFLHLPSACRLSYNKLSISTFATVRKIKKKNKQNRQGAPQLFKEMRSGPRQPEQGRKGAEGCSLGTGKLEVMGCNRI